MIDIVSKPFHLVMNDLVIRGRRISFGFFFPSVEIALAVLTLFSFLLLDYK